VELKKLSGNVIVLTFFRTDSYKQLLFAFSTNNIKQTIKLGFCCSRDSQCFPLKQSLLTDAGDFSSVLVLK
jgi:hypothetical protein